MTGSEFALVENLMVTAVGDVQRAVRPHDVRVVLGQDAVVDQAIAELDHFHEELGSPPVLTASGICVASQLDVPNNSFARPGILLVDVPLRVVAACDGLSMNERTHLLHRWIDAASSGEGRYYPFRWAARASVGSTLLHLANTMATQGKDLAGKPVNAASAIIEYLDTSLPLVGPVFRYAIERQRAFSYQFIELGSGDITTTDNT